jgi:hypothetical protein
VDAAVVDEEEEQPVLQVVLQSALKTLVLRQDAEEEVAAVLELEA